MKFEPKTAEEVKQDMPRDVLWPSGQYDFEVLNGKDAKTGPNSKNPGADMIKLRIKIFNSQGEEKIIFDNLLESAAWKLYNAAVACGLEGKYNNGELVGGDFEGCTGKLKLRIGKPTDAYPDPKNEVQDYLIPASSSETKPKVVNAKGRNVELNDAIPEW